MNVSMSDINYEQLMMDELERHDTWWSSSQEQPYIIERQEPHFCVCDIILNKKSSKFTFIWRCFLTWLAGLCPSMHIKISVYRLLGVTIGKNVFISPGVFIDPFYPKLIELKDNSFLGLGARILTHEYTAKNYRIGKVVIGEGSVIGAYSTVRAGVTVGTKCTIGAHSFVNKDVADNQTVGGVPARPLSSENN